MLENYIYELKTDKPFDTVVENIEKTDRREPIPGLSCS